MDYRIYLGLISHRWTYEILTVLRSHPKRYTDILNAISPGPSAKVLLESLGRLQDHHLVQRVSCEDTEPYKLTDAGRELLPIVATFVEELQRWGEAHLPSE